MRDALTYDRLDVGSVLCDMHDGMKSPHESIVFGKPVVMMCENGHEIIDKMLPASPRYTNKHLVIVSMHPHLNHWVAAWSYDGVRLGFVNVYRNGDQP